MIGVNLLYLRVNEDLAKLGQTGYSNNDEFNRSMNEMELILLEYYHMKFGLSQSITDSVLPFVKDELLTIVDSVAQNPDDYAHRLDVEYKLVVNTGSEPTVTFEPMNLEKVGENRNASAIRKPLQGVPATYSYRQQSDGFHVKPATLTGQVKLTYLRIPTFGLRAVTLGAEDNEIYNPAGSTDLEWPDFEISNFVDGLMFFKGVETRRSDLIQWMSVNKKFKTQFQ